MSHGQYARCTDGSQLQAQFSHVKREKSIKQSGLHNQTCTHFFLQNQSNERSHCTTTSPGSPSCRTEKTQHGTRTSSKVAGVESGVHRKQKRSQSAAGETLQFSHHFRRRTRIHSGTTPKKGPRSGQIDAKEGVVQTIHKIVGGPTNEQQLCIEKPTNLHTAS